MTEDKLDRAKMYDALCEISDALNDLYITMDTIKLGLDQELVEHQVGAALNSIRWSIKSIWGIALDAVWEYGKTPDLDTLCSET